MSGTRPATNWARTVDPGDLLIAAGNKAFVINAALDNPGIGETIRRCRGLLSVSSDQSAAQEDQVGAMGAIVVNDVAIAVGATAIPGPVTEADDDGWFLWVPFGQKSNINVNVGSRATYQYEFDSKAMRRVEQGFGIAFMVENASATTGIRVSLTISLLTSRH